MEGPADSGGPSTGPRRLQELLDHVLLRRMKHDRRVTIAGRARCSPARHTPAPPLCRGVAMHMQCALPSASTPVTHKLGRDDRGPTSAWPGRSLKQTTPAHVWRAAQPARRLPNGQPLVHLPPRHFYTHKFELAKHEAEQYTRALKAFKETVTESGNKPHTLSCITELRQLCCHPSLSSLVKEGAAVRKRAAK